MARASLEHESAPPLTARDVAAIFRVDVRAPGRWAREGKLPADFKTVGGHLRWRAETIQAALERGTTERAS